MFEDSFKKYLLQKIPITNEEFDYALTFFKAEELAKGTVLLAYGALANHQYFIVNGLTCSFIMDDCGSERTIQISLENSWTGDLESFTKKKLSQKKIVCITDCFLLTITKDRWEALLIEIPKFERLFRILFQNAYIELTVRVELLQTLNATQRYILFCQNFPELIEKVELRFIASFLNIKPETLSRIRKSLN